VSQVTEHCDRAILLEKGSIIADGEPADVVRLYGSLTLPEMAAVH